MDSHESNPDIKGKSIEQVLINTTTIYVVILINIIIVYKQQLVDKFLYIYDILSTKGNSNTLS